MKSTYEARHGHKQVRKNKGVQKALLTGRRIAAFKRAVDRARRTNAEQLTLLDSRPGNSGKERGRLTKVK